MIFKPERILLAGFAVFSLVLILAPLEVKIDLQTGAFGFIALCSLAFILGSQLADRLRMRSARAPVSRRHLARIELRLFNVTLALGLIGNGLHIWDRFVLRGVGSLSGIAAREALVDTSASMVSLLSGLLYPFGFLPIFIYLGARAMRASRWQLLIAAALFMVPAAEALVLFSRSFLLVSTALIYFGLSITIFRGRVLPAKLAVPAIFGVIIVLLVSIVIFRWRLDEMQLGLIDSIFQSGYGYTIGPNERAESILDQSGAASGFLSALLPVLQYFTHAVFEFQLLWQERSYQVFTFGALHFTPYVKALGILGLVQAPDLTDVFPRPGVFTTFFGPLWVDFGWFAIAVMFLFGAIARLLARAAQSGDTGAYPIYAYICVVLFFAPVVNFLISAQGMYTINAFAIFYLLTRRLARYRVRKSDDEGPRRSQLTSR